MKPMRSQAGFEIEGASPAQGPIVNGIALRLSAGDGQSTAEYIGQHINAYKLVVTVNVPNSSPPGAYSFPK
jgi:hypothetical protein